MWFFKLGFYWKGELQRGWGRVGEAVGEGLGKGWGGGWGELGFLYFKNPV